MTVAKPEDWISAQVDAYWIASYAASVNDAHTKKCVKCGGKAGPEDPRCMECIARDLTKEVK